ncbi:anhydro-N-acetylmuramic acid kinase [Gilliamella sp. Pra-s65]|uniref:anhydro-N-acetylmuramic acid kinase n=1 Tax=unclassified Gilliamella TaxID=2685620 RepID=UPI0013665167|nr:MULTISPECIES: anhydro-N-acetylmuramic acid kinase [unclassified Gilliamella]MWN91185.1 anhydro-N-acetylmuramic acid kinase [Gilliamella sp. Pra-s65]MWP74161.1 anhydro-N-acetylmuramic acid kinase [Gilliamella sp. Pra-s52]
MQNLYIGVMSGTSMDGIDIAIVNIIGKHVTSIASSCYPIPTNLKQQLLTLCEKKQTTLQNLGELDYQLGGLFADSINQFLKDNKIDKQQVKAIGCHGQTIYHAPNGENPFTLQIGDANIIAAKTGITTIADFRRKDMAYGGQGAPLVPAFHKAVLQDPQINRVVLNIGGISNISVLIPNHPTIGYDTGPGNVLLDCWISQNLSKSYDKDGLWAKTGKVNQDLLNKLFDEDYFKILAPKSTGRELFNLTWLHKKLTHSQLPPQDIQATLVEFTASSIEREINKLTIEKQLPCQLLVCGGGAKNPIIMQRLTELLPNWQVMATDEIGINSNDMEAIAFAWLAYCRTNNIPSNIPEVTGASQAVCLGVVYQ